MKGDTVTRSAAKMKTRQLQLARELRLRDALAHRRSRRDAARHGLHQVVHVVRAAPLCVTSDACKYVREKGGVPFGGSGRRSRSRARAAGRARRRPSCPR